MLLAIDVGNTETKLGFFAEGDADVVNSWRITTEARRTTDEVGIVMTNLFETASIDRSAIAAIVIASVVPRLDYSLQLACERYFGITPSFFKAHKQALMPVRTERPEEVGADLVAVAIGAKEKYGAPLIVISYGTATVFMAISPEGEYMGVAIAPGINISIDALVGRTAKLPQIALEAPGAAIGRDTISALQSGIVYGFVGQTEELVRRMRAEMGVDARVVATGGLAQFVAKHCPVIDEVSPNLSLRGLRAYYESVREK